MASLTCRMELAGSLASARAVLSDPGSFLCFPGISRPSAEDAARFTQDLDLPVLGSRSQTVVLAVRDEGADPGSACVAFSTSGDLLSVSGCWRLEAGDGRVRAELTVECRVAEELRRQAVDEYRSRSPLPIRTDADAILTRLVDDLVREKLEQDVATYRQRVAELLARRGDA